MECNTRRDLIRFYRIFVSPHSRRGIAAVALLMLAVSMSLPMPLVTRYLIDDVLPGTSSIGLGTIGLALVVVTLLGLVLTYASTLLSGWFRERVIADVQHAMFRQLLRMPLAYHDARSPGYLMSRIGNDTGNLNTFLAEAAVTILQSSFTFVAGVIAIGVLNAKLALACWLMILPYSLVIRRFRSSLRERSERMMEQQGRVWSTMDEAVNELLPIKLFQAEEFFGRRLRDSLDVAIALNISSLRLNVTYAMVTGLFTRLLNVYVLVLGGRFVMQGEMTVGTLVAFLSFVGFVFGPVRALSQLYGALQRASVAMRRVFEILDAEDEYAADCAGEVDPVGDIVFEDVCFAYEGTGSALTDLNLRIPAGKVTAFVGVSGSGKSTIAKLLGRIYDHYSGTIRIGDTDLRDFDLAAIRRRIAFVPQEVALYSFSLRENLLLGRTDLDDESLGEACRIGGIDALIAERGLEFEVGAQGGRISGGEKQRLGIARAVVGSSEIIVLDEATSELDGIVEQLVVGNLIRRFDGKTIIVVAHRMETVVAADQICVLDEGRVVDTGRHEELLERCGTYRSLNRLAPAKRAGAGIGVAVDIAGAPSMLPPVDR